MPSPGAKVVHHKWRRDDPTAPPLPFGRVSWRCGGCGLQILSASRPRSKGQFVIGSSHRSMAGTGSVMRLVFCHEDGAVVGEFVSRSQDLERPVPVDCREAAVAVVMES